MNGAQDRREGLLAATVALLHEQGLAVLRTRDVTTRAGVGVGLLNHYFTWSDLRAAALGRVLHADLDDSLPDPDPLTPQDRRDLICAHAFAPEARPIWRLWVEAAEIAASDAALAAVLSRMDCLLQARTLGLIRRGVVARAWTCPDPEGSASRFLALHDGLAMGLVWGQPGLDVAMAGHHLARGFALECPALRAAT